MGALALVALVFVLSGAIAGARTPRQVHTVPILEMAPGSVTVSLGDAPAWLPLSGTEETVTVIAGRPRGADAGANASVAFIRTPGRCASSPAGVHTLYDLGGLFSSAHSAAHHAGAFAPDGGAPRTTYLASRGGVRVDAGSADSVRACVWLGRGSARSGDQKLVDSALIPLLNRTFAASVSDLAGTGGGQNGLAMDAFDGGRAFRYSAVTVQCGRQTTDGPVRIPAGTPGFEDESIGASPCSGDESTFDFSGPDVRGRIVYPSSDALSLTPPTLSVGACELDPLVGATVTQAALYLHAVGCRLGRMEVSPHTATLARGDVAWAAVDGGVAEIAPRHSTVDLVLNGRP